MLAAVMVEHNTRRMLFRLSIPPAVAAAASSGTEKARAPSSTSSPDSYEPPV